MYANKESPCPGQTTLVILSGGLDSAVTLALARANTAPLQLFALSFDYGQKHVKELSCAHELAEHYSVCHFRHYVDLTRFRGLNLHEGTPPAPDDEINLIPPTWKPNRNVIMLAIAGAYLPENHINILAGGWHQEDYPGYPDCRYQTLSFMELTLSHSLAMPIAIWAPLLYKSKAEIVRLGTKLHVPFQLTWSCYAGGEKPCHKCDACIRRERAFTMNDMKDPLL